MRRSGAALAVVLLAAMLWHGTAARGLSGTMAVLGDASPERRLQEEEEDRSLPDATGENGDATAKDASNTNTDEEDEAGNSPIAGPAGAAQGGAWQAAAADPLAEPDAITAEASHKEESMPAGIGQHAVADDELAERYKVRRRCSVAGMPLTPSKACESMLHARL